jgi:transposase
MLEISTIGLDIAKNVFQVHAVDQTGATLVRRQLRRGGVEKFFAELSPCLVGMEACATSHYWARRIAALGHEVRLVPPVRVKAYVKRGKKNDAADAAAICEAVTRPQMRFVPIKSAEQQGALILHRTRDILVRQRTMQICALRSHMAEFGLVTGRGWGGFAKLVAIMNSESGRAVPEVACKAFRLIVTQIEEIDEKIDALEKEIVAWHRGCAASRNLATVPGIGPIIASALTAAVPDVTVFKSGRQFAAWLGLVPSQNSTGGKDRLGRITKAGDRYLRRLLVVGATGLIRYKRKSIPGGLEWVTRLLTKKPVRLVTVALANKMARIAWAILSRGEAYREVAPMPAA